MKSTEPAARVMQPPGEYGDDHVRDVRYYTSLVDATSTMHLDIDLNKINYSRDLKSLIEDTQEFIQRERSPERRVSPPAGGDEPDPLTAERRNCYVRADTPKLRGHESEAALP